MEIIEVGTKHIVQNSINEDKKLVGEHLEKFKLAASDVLYALNREMIPKNLQTDQFLSDIINVVLSGESVQAKYYPEEGKVILEIGMKIYNTVSIKRKQYTGKIITKTHLQGQYSYQEKNVLYDEKYVKENPPIGEAPKNKN